MESCSSNCFWKYCNILIVLKYNYCIKIQYNLLQLKFYCNKIVIFYFALILSKNYLDQIAFSVIFLIYDLLLFSKETPTQVLSYEICEIIKKTYFEEHLLTTASPTIFLFP